MWAITDCAVPVIGAINGPALGAGLAFAACCDILIASDNATFGTTEINVGLLGASSHLSMLVGRHKAREMFFTGERSSGGRAVPPRRRTGGGPARGADADGARARGSLAAKSPIALRLAKESMNRVEDLPLKDAYRTEQDYTARLQRYEDAAEARVRRTSRSATPTGSGGSRTTAGRDATQQRPRIVAGPRCPPRTVSANRGGLRARAGHRRPSAVPLRMTCPHRSV